MNKTEADGSAVPVFIISSRKHLRKGNVGHWEQHQTAAVRQCMQAHVCLLHLWGHSQPPVGICNDPVTAFLCWRLRCSTKWITLTIQERRERVCVSEEKGNMSQLFRHRSFTPHQLQTIYKHSGPTTEAVWAAFVPLVRKMCFCTVLVVSLTRPNVPSAPPCLKVLRDGTTGESINSPSHSYKEETGAAHRVLNSQKYRFPSMHLTVFDGWAFDLGQISWI